MSGECEFCAKYEQDLQLAEQQMRALRRQLSAARNQLIEDKKADPKVAEISRLLELWRDKVKGGRKNISVSVEHPRAEAFKKALSLYPIEDIEDAIRGITLDAWWMEKANEPKHILGKLEHWRDLWRKRKDVLLAEAEKNLQQPRVRLDPISKILNGLENAGCEWRAVPNNPDMWQAQCPAHDDKNPSLSILRNPQTGKVKVTCWPGCEDIRVLEVMGLTIRDLYENADQDFATEAGVMRAAQDHRDRKARLSIVKAA